MLILTISVSNFDFGPGVAYLLLIIITIVSLVAFEAYRVFAPNPSEIATFKLKKFDRMDDPMTWEFTLVNNGSATARNVCIEACEYTRDQIPTTESSTLSKIDEWPPDREIQVHYSIKEPDSVWIQLDIDSYRFDDQIRFLRSNFGDLERKDTRFP